MDIELVKISELEPLITAPNAAVLPASIDDQSRKISIETLRTSFANNSQLIGNTTVVAPAAGDDSNRVPSTGWVQDELSALGLNPATATATGTVKTNSTDDDPVVYLKNEVDDLIDLVSTEIIPVNRGGTNATTAAAARTNLGAAVSGSNNDITALTALASVPGVISTFVNAVVDAVFPIGSIRSYAGEFTASNYLLCNGSEVSRTTYSALFAIIGTIYGAGDGINTFGLPNLVGRVPIGGGGSYGLGATGGSETHTLTTAEMPAHSHTGSTNTAGVHSHTYNYRTSNTLGTGSSRGDFNNGTLNGSSTIANDEAGAHNHTVTTTNTGGGQAHNNMQPYLAINFYIRAL
ncbi:tail fiber protein [Oculatella sp. FACHB-28]|uniref:phage tail protein n=1 Tax=Oculatella sp. FACHB-28 TaxID=2692845 RepID=UPI001686C6F3|nr:tail fiber protein [Oculatella sp. FACHB-28]MBD2060522.1 tail fiber protein [Oculatella sp. FACHB-28]